MTVKRKRGKGRFLLDPCPGSREGKGVHRWDGDQCSLCGDIAVEHYGKKRRRSALPVVIGHLQNYSRLPMRREGAARYRRRSEARARKRQYNAKYIRSAEQRVRDLRRQREYSQRPEVKAHRREAGRRYRARKREKTSVKEAIT